MIGMLNLLLCIGLFWFQNCLFIVNFNLIGKFLKPWIYPYTPGMLCIHYAKMALHKQGIFCRV